METVNWMYLLDPEGMLKILELVCKIFTVEMLNSMLILAISLPLSSTISSWIVLFFLPSCFFFSANENESRKQNRLQISVMQ